MGFKGVKIIQVCFRDDILQLFKPKRQIQISLRNRAVWSEASLDAF